MAGVLALMALVVSLPQKEVKAQPGVSVSFQMFYDELAPYGQWIDDPDYGYVWAPRAGNDFRPYYTNGRWVLTEYGNTWVSDYDWGWAPFHYGRWTYSPFYGWVWIPGSEWGPAWVSWRSGGGYYGWAPMGPGINININIGSYYPNDWWVFIPNRYIYQPSYYSRWRGPQYNTTIINHTTIINNYHNNTYVYGPRRDEVERYTGQRVNVYNLRESSRAGRSTLRSNTVELYRPRVSTTAANTGRREAPRNAVRAQQPLRTTATHNGDNRTTAERETPARNVSPARNVQQADRRSGLREIQTAAADSRNSERQQIERQVAPQRPEQQENRQRTRLAAREDNKAAMERVRSERAAQDQIQQQQGQRQQAEQQRLRSQEANQRGQRMAADSRRPEMQQRTDRPQREWRRPEPRQAERPASPQQTRHPERVQPQRQAERPQMQRQQAPQRQQTPGNEAPRGGNDRGRGR